MTRGVQLRDLIQQHVHDEAPETAEMMPKHWALVLMLSFVPPHAEKPSASDY